jgi:hypothetical protein
MWASIRGSSVAARIQGSIMADTDPDNLEKVDQEIRINELKEKAKELAGGEMTSFEAEDADPEVLEAFWQSVVDVESGGLTSSHEQLAQAGVALPPPGDLTDQQTADKLREIVARLAERGTFLLSTDHLSDRELYARLWSDVLHETMPAACVGSARGVFIIDLVSSGSEEANELYLRYYASQETRDLWLKEFPDYEMPPRQSPPYDRDRTLPKPPDHF